MKIRDYIKSQKLTWKQLADKAGVSRQTLYNVMTKPAKSNIASLQKIEKATGGAVTIAEMLQ